MDELDKHRREAFEKQKQRIQGGKPATSIKAGGVPDDVPDDSYEISGYCSKCYSINLKPHHHGYQGKTWRWRECSDCGHEFKQRRVEVLSEEGREDLEAEGKEVRLLDFYIQRM